MADKKVSTTIRYVVPGTQPPIFLAGSFSSPEWQPEEMQYTTDDNNEHEFYREVKVEEGKEYQYKFRIGLGEWWILNEGSPTATDDIGNRNNILLVPHSEVQQKEEESKAETEKDEKKEETTEIPVETSNSYLPLVHESSPVPNPATPKPEQKEKSKSGNQTEYLRQLDGMADGGQHAREALPADIEALPPVTAPLSKETHEEESSLESQPEAEQKRTSKTETDSPEETIIKPSATESVKKSVLETKDELLGQNKSNSKDEPSTIDYVKESVLETKDKLVGQAESNTKDNSPKATSGPSASSAIESVKDSVLESKDKLVAQKDFTTNNSSLKDSNGPSVMESAKESALEIKNECFGQKDSNGPSTLDSAKDSVLQTKDQLIGHKESNEPTVVESAKDSVLQTKDQLVGHKGSNEPLAVESVKESVLETKDEWFGQKLPKEPTHSHEPGSENTDSKFSNGQTQDEVKRNSSHSSETSDPVNHSDHIDDSFVIVPEHDEKAGAAQSSKGLRSKTENDSEANTFQDGRVGSVPTDDENTEHQSIEKNQEANSEGTRVHASQNSASSDTNRIVVGLPQSLDGAASPTLPLPVTPFVVGNRQLGDGDILSNNEGPSITLQPATPGPANLSTIEPNKQLGEATSSAVDESASTQVTNRTKQSTPTSGRATSPNSTRTIPKGAKPNKGLVKSFLHLVFVEWIGKLFGKLWSGFKRQPRNEKLKIVLGFSIATVAYLVLYR